MRKIREVLRLHYECGCENRQIALACCVSPSTVSDYLQKAAKRNLTWEVAKTLSEAEVESRLFARVGKCEPATRVAIDFDWVHSEMLRDGVTLQLLWGDYQKAALEIRRHPYQYSQFCELYSTWRNSRRLSMRQTHRAGEKLFVDYSGKKPRIADRETGELTEVELYVAVLGATNYTFAEVTRTQQLGEFCASTVRALEYFGRSPRILVPDQLRSAVSRSDRYDPDINQTFNDLAQHYGMAVIPAPPRKPKAKAKVENGVLIAQRWILARLRNRTFFSLEELNHAIAELLEELNHRKFKKLEGTRYEAFEKLDKPAMRALPVQRFEVAERKTTRANIDYHVEFDGRYYSVPYQLRQQLIDLRVTTTIVEAFHRGERVASHRRTYGNKGTAVTAREHRPQCHEDYGDWPPERMLTWAAKFGNHVEEVVRRKLSEYPYPEMAYRAVLGILRCAEKHGAERMNAACERALAGVSNTAPHRRYIEAILNRGLDKAPPITSPTTPRSIPHENVRGSSYYNQENASE